MSLSKLITEPPKESDETFCSLHKANLCSHSACDRHRVVWRGCAVQIVGISLIILFLLFVLQQLGTGKVGVLFSPIVLVWFAFISGIGLFNIVKHDWRILKAFSPAEWFSFFLRNGSKGYAMLGGVVLCITGALAAFPLQGLDGQF